VLLGRAAGLSEVQLGHLGDATRPQDIYDDASWAIVEYAQVSTRNEPITNELYARLLTHFSEKQVIEICFTIGLSNTINRFHATFLTEVDERTREALAPSCPLHYPEPDEDPHG
jgi:alkylhydroperoxidase family enzyme